MKKELIIGILAVFLVLLVLTACENYYPVDENEPLNETQESPEPESNLNLYELTEDDFILNDDWDGTTVTVLGVKIGDSYQDIIDHLGLPERIKEFENGAILNLEYSKKLGSDQLVLIFHTKNNVVERITVYYPINKYLKGQTKLNRTKAQIYADFGIAERFIDIHKMRRFIWNTKGFEILLRKGQQYGYSFFFPKENEPIVVNSKKSELNP